MTAVSNPQDRLSSPATPGGNLMLRMMSAPRAKGRGASDFLTPRSEQVSFAP
jgi:hypothetical protein